MTDTITTDELYAVAIKSSKLALKSARAGHLDLSVIRELEYK